jgi:hypothetical protein
MLVLTYWLRRERVNKDDCKATMVFKDKIKELSDRFYSLFRKLINYFLFYYLGFVT